MTGLKNNEMVSLGYLIENCFNRKQIYIPLIQRNYKWKTEDASKLARDLWKSYRNNKQSRYTVGMITLYDEKNGKMQLIDGQQRIITLALLLRYLNPDEEYFKFEFERDERRRDNEKRLYFINKIIGTNDAEKAEYLYTDTMRFKENFDAVRLPLTMQIIKNVFDILVEYKLNGYTQVSNEAQKGELIEKIQNCASDFGCERVTSILLDVVVGKGKDYGNIIKKIVCPYLISKETKELIVNENNDCNHETIEAALLNMQFLPNNNNIDLIKKAILNNETLKKEFEFTEWPINQDYIDYLLNNVSE